MEFKTPLDRIEHEERDYAEKMIAEGRMWQERLKLYSHMATNLNMAYEGHNEPLGHVDLGTGPGNLPVAIAKKLLEQGRRDFTIVGVDVNPHLAQHAVEQAQTVESLQVSSHLQWRRERVKGKLRKIFYADARSLDATNLTPNGRIVIVLDDIRLNFTKVLPEILRRLQAQSPIFTMSHTLMGVGGEMALEATSKPLQMKYADARPEMYRITQEVRTAVHQWAARSLMSGGHLYMAHRGLSFVSPEMAEAYARQQIPRVHQAHLEVESAGPILSRGIDHLRQHTELEWVLSGDPRMDSLPISQTLLAFILQRTEVPFEGS